MVNQCVRNGFEGHFFAYQDIQREIYLCYSAIFRHSTGMDAQALTALAVNACM